MTQEQDNSGSIHSIDISADSQPDESKEHVDIDSDSCYSEPFSKIWREITSDNHLTLFGFRRYRTTHLLNIRFLEAEIDKIDHDLYQAGLQLNQPLGREHTIDRLGLKQAKKDSNQMKAEELVNKALVMRLRRSIKEYDDSLKAFNTVMSMETFSLADNTNQSGCRQDLHAYERFKTRMLRVDLPLRYSSRDPVQHFVRKGLRRLWYALNLWKLRADDEEQGRIGPLSRVMATWDRTYQNTARIAEAVTRFIIAIVTGASLVIPLAVLSYQDSQESRLLIVISFICFFCFLLSLIKSVKLRDHGSVCSIYGSFDCFVIK